ncbi:hypothetical protein AB0756_01720 [Tolypothrix campylonemoides VB511288_2]|uniref:Transposase n=1 Tax=Tolypothrix campylonemoides VB511288_2 TaxID=3232311 RepID=A0ABW8X3F1_9CYAN
MTQREIVDFTLPAPGFVCLRVMTRGRLASLKRRLRNMATSR